MFLKTIKNSFLRLGRMLHARENREAFWEILKFTNVVAATMFLVSHDLYHQLFFLGCPNNSPFCTSAHFTRALFIMPDPPPHRRSIFISYDTNPIYSWMERSTVRVKCTVEPSVSGHPWGQKTCPFIKRGVRLWEVKNEAGYITECLLTRGFRRISQKHSTKTPASPRIQSLTLRLTTRPPGLAH